MSADLSFLWLEITGRCQLSCTHCYAESGPQGTDGTMADGDWFRVIDQAAELSVRMVQFIGGEPTLHPSFVALVRHALSRSLAVEVFSNLTHVSPTMWDVISHPGVSLATSYYSDSAGQHEAITRGRGSHARTRTAIAEAVRRSVPIRVGLIDLDDGQRVEQARAELVSIGVTNIGTDRLRQVGRGVRAQAPDISQLCGACGRGKVAIAANGEVWPCVFSRWMPVGNVLENSLSDILTSSTMAETTQQLERQLPPLSGKKCGPDICTPECGPSCSPACVPANNCVPTGSCGPDYS